MNHATSPTSSTSHASKPNLIWIFGDQHRGQALSCAGDVNVSTPSLDALAKHGFRSTAAVSGSPLCCPFRGSLLTSRYPHNAVPCLGDPLSPALPTVAHAFRDAGYDTSWFGKWHLDGPNRQPGVKLVDHIVPRDRRGAFDTWIGYENNNSPFKTSVHGHDARGREIEHHRLPDFETNALTDLCIERLREQAKQVGTADARPFFTVLSVQPPHTPYVAPSQWMDRHAPESVKLRPNVPDVADVQQEARTDLAGYYAMIENLDWNIGRIVAALAELKLDQNTIVMYFSDHGDMHGGHGLIRKSVPWEESIRIPFIVGGMTGPQFKPATEPVLINHVDIAPTSLGLCGIEPPDWMTGFDYSGCYRSDRLLKDMPDSAYLQICDKNKKQRPWRGVITRDGWKYACLEHQPWVMYDLNTDPYEQVNLVDKHTLRATRDQLHRRLVQWLNATGDSFPLPTFEDA